MLGLRRAAKRRGFRIVKDWTGTWSLVDIKIAPPRALFGLLDVSLAEIEVALSTPLPLSKIRTRNSKPVVGTNHPGAGAYPGASGAPENASDRTGLLS